MHMWSRGSNLKRRHSGGRAGPLQIAKGKIIAGKMYSERTTTESYDLHFSRNDDCKIDAPVNFARSAPLTIF